MLDARMLLRISSKTNDVWINEQGDKIRQIMQEYQ